LGEKPLRCKIFRRFKPPQSDRTIVLGLMAVWTVLLIAWAYSNGCNSVDQRRRESDVKANSSTSLA
jgi:hypothetical protein